LCRVTSICDRSRMAYSSRMWKLLVRCPDQELDQLIAAAARGERVFRGEPIGAPGPPIEFGSEWWLPRMLAEDAQAGARRPLFMRAEHVDGVTVVERNGLRLPLVDVTIVDRCNSTIWRNRLSSPRVGFARVQFLDGALPPLSIEDAVRKALEEGLGGKPMAKRVRDLCQIKGEPRGFGIRTIQSKAKKIRAER
jgi:hypothetical protein